MSGLLSDDYVDARARAMRIASLAKRVLFIGNSLTFWNQGVDVMVKKLVPGIETLRVAVGGATLETLSARRERCVFFSNEARALGRAVMTRVDSIDTDGCG